MCSVKLVLKYRFYETKNNKNIYYQERQNFLKKANGIRRCHLYNVKVILLCKLGKFQPTHGLLVQFIVKEGQTLGHGRYLVHADGAAAEGLLYSGLLLLQGLDVLFQLLVFLAFLEGEFALLLREARLAAGLRLGGG